MKSAKNNKKMTTEEKIAWNKAYTDYQYDIIPGTKKQQAAIEKITEKATSFIERYQFRARDCRENENKYKKAVLLTYAAGKFCGDLIENSV